MPSLTTSTLPLVAGDECPGALPRGRLSPPTPNERGRAVGQAPEQHPVLHTHTCLALARVVVVLVMALGLVMAVALIACRAVLVVVVLAPVRVRALG